MAFDKKGMRISKEVKEEYIDETKIFHGEVLDTKDVITFQGTTVEEIEHAFRDSIDDYLEFCHKRGEEPDKPFSGKFILRLPSDLHRKIYLHAYKSGMSLNKWIIDILKKSIY